MTDPIAKEVRGGVTRRQRAPGYFPVGAHSDQYLYITASDTVMYDYAVLSLITSGLLLGLFVSRSLGLILLLYTLLLRYSITLALEPWRCNTRIKMRVRSFFFSSFTYPGDKRPPRRHMRFWPTWSVSLLATIGAIIGKLL